jgi:hypothetical protein
MRDLCEVVVKGLALDRESNSPIVILKDRGTTQALPIWIGYFEANAIALEIEKVKTPRPMTHDLMADLIARLGGRLSRVVVHDLQENTFLAAIVLERDGNDILVDSRPSDAIALALRTGSPIFVTREVLDKSQSFDLEEDLYQGERLRDWIDTLKPDDFSGQPG